MGGIAAAILLCFGFARVGRERGGSQTTKHVSLVVSAREAPAVTPQSSTCAPDLPADGLSGFDIARANLACAQGLPGAEDLEVDALVRRLDEWSGIIKTATARHWYRFRQRPEEFEHSEAYFRMLVMVTVLQRELNVGYNPRLASVPSEADAERGQFFANAQDLFLHGLLGNRRAGTCASMPVLLVAIGRRLGYPLKLVRARSHQFVRWESPGGGERLNIEASAQGLVTPPDEHYRQWPLPLSTEEIRDGQYLQSLSPAEELAEFLVTRACCLRFHGREVETRAALQQAQELAPQCQRYRMALASSTQPNPSQKQ